MIHQIKTKYFRGTSFYQHSFKLLFKLLQFESGAIYMETSILQSNIRTMTKIPRELPAFVLLCCTSIHFHFVWVHDNVQETYGDRGSSSLTLSRVLSWLSIPKACYGLHEATFLPKSTLKSTQQTVTAGHQNKEFFFFFFVWNVWNLWQVCRDSLSDVMAASMSFGSKVMAACMTKMLL